MTGTVLALTLILASVGILTSMRNLLDIQFGQIQREDATVLTTAETGLAQQLSNLRGVATIEPARFTPVPGAAGEHTYSTTLTDTTMHGFRTPDGHTRELRADGLLAGAPLADRLGVAVSDIFTVTPAFGAPRQLQVAACWTTPLAPSTPAGTPPPRWRAMTVNRAERTTELATPCAAGVSVRRLTAALATENLAATLLAVPLGLVAGILAACAFVRSFNSDMLAFHLSLGPLPIVLAAVAVLTAAGLSQLPATRAVDRIDIAHVVRERAQ
ncbi:FtsX-like permease family protein [Nocardia sp. CA-084685]|uniref:FtsX-like permease family protein n=1 Tax=Nocardia sp. CA-084685 TaxID=3239970 RepID=UPI003D96A129